MVDGKWWQDCAPNREGYNDPLSDLHAMHEAEKVLHGTVSERYYALILRNVVTDSDMKRDDQAFDLERRLVHCSRHSPTTSRSLLRTLELWK